ncbi:MAG: succinate dehydrogenase cytochrome b subunit [Limisphaerales bacterium]
MIPLLRKLFCSSLGKKYIMAATGVVMVLFVIGHLAGNLQVFLGQEAINRYGHLLQTNVELLWPVRLTLLTIICLHIWSAASLTRENRAARPVPYTRWEPTAANYASRTMLMSGIIVALFIIYHLLHFTVMVQGVNLTGKGFEGLMDSEHRHDIYGMLILGFRQPVVCLIYMVGVGLLCLHLSHGISAMFQSLGWKNRSYGPCLDRAARWGSVVIFLGYISIPLSILLRLIP